MVFIKNFLCVCNGIILGGVLAPWYLRRIVESVLEPKDD